MLLGRFSTSAPDHLIRAIRVGRLNCGFFLINRCREGVFEHLAEAAEERFFAALEVLRGLLDPLFVDLADIAHEELGVGLLVIRPAELEGLDIVGRDEQLDGLAGFFSKSRDREAIILAALNGQTGCFGMLLESGRVVAILVDIGDVALHALDVDHLMDQSLEHIDKRTVERFGSDAELIPGFAGGIILPLVTLSPTEHSFATAARQDVDDGQHEVVAEQLLIQEVEGIGDDRRGDHEWIISGFHFVFLWFVLFELLTAAPSL